MRVGALLLLLCRSVHLYCVPGDINGSCSRIKDRQYQIRGVNVKPVWNHLLQGKEIRRKQSTNSRLNYEKESVLNDEKPIAIKPKSFAISGSVDHIRSAKAHGIKNLLYNRDPIDSFERAVAGDEFDNRRPFEPIRIIKIEDSNESDTVMKRKLATADRINRANTQPNTQRIIDSLSRKEPTHMNELLKPQIIPFSSRDIAEHAPLLPEKIAAKNNDVKENILHEANQDPSASEKGEVNNDQISNQTHAFSGNASDLVEGKVAKMKTIDSTIIEEIQNESKPAGNKTEQVTTTTDLVKVEENTTKKTKSDTQKVLDEDLKENLNIEDEDQIDESLYFEDEGEDEKGDTGNEKHKTKLDKTDEKQSKQKAQLPKKKETVEAKEEPEEKIEKEIQLKNEENEENEEKEEKEEVEEEGKEKVETMKAVNVEENVDEEETATKFKVGGDETHIRSNMRAASLKDAPNAKYYYPPKDSVPLPSCFYNPSGYVCCNLQLNNLIEDTFEEVRKKPGYNSCNIARIAKILQVKSEEMFHHPFESVVALSDFAQNVHFAGDLVCKVEIDGKYMITYATPYDAEHAVDNSSKGKKENIEAGKASEKVKRKTKGKKSKGSLPIHNFRM